MEQEKNKNKEYIFSYLGNFLLSLFFWSGFLKKVLRNFEDDNRLTWICLFLLFIFSMIFCVF
ncbi:TPA: hypothetical protein ACF0SI_002800 [Enterococcus hirae]